MNSKIERLKKILNRFGTGKNKIDDVTSMVIVDRDAYKITEGDHSMVVQVEMMTVHPGRVIYTSTIKKWLPPHDNEEVTDEDRARILKKICMYFDNIGYTYDIQ